MVSEKEKSKLTVVIPAYNEINRIADTLDKTVRYCRDNLSKFEIIVVDDGSSDGTGDFVEKTHSDSVRCIRHKFNQGKGAAIATGFKAANLPYVLFMDADGSTSIEEVEKLFAKMDQDCSLVIGTRKDPDSNIIKSQGIMRSISGEIFINLSRVVLGLKFTDYNCGFKLFRLDLARKIVEYQTIKRFAFDVEYLCIANQLNKGIKEAAITWQDKKGSKIAVFIETPRSFFDLFRIKINIIKGHYG